MAKKSFLNGLVYSTNNELMKKETDAQNETIAPANQSLFVRIETKHRAGKTVTLVEGYHGAGIERVGKQLKNYCATGGTIDNGIIVIQGNHREKIVQWLKKQGFGKVKS